MKFKLSILLTILVIISTTVFAQKGTTKTVGTKPTPSKMPTVKEILAKYVQVIGGRAVNKKIKSRMMKGTLELSPMGIKGTFEIYAAAPNKSLSKSNLAGIGELAEGFDGQTAWGMNPIQGIREKKGDELAQTKLINDFYREINLDKIYPKLEFKGTEKVGDSDAYVIVGTPGGSPPDTLYFDTKTGFLVRQDTTAISPEGNMPTKTFFEDMREVDGVKLPFKIRSVLPQFEIVLTIGEVKNNVAIDDGKFVKPKE